MFAGGIADKLGNRYESKWLVFQFLEVFAGRAEWIRFEGIDTAFQGFEFAVHERDRVNWHQTKVSNRNGNWTISALNREGVLSAFKKRLQASATDGCIFVSEDPAKDLNVLASKAKIASTAHEFQQSLGTGDSDLFKLVLDAWSIGPDLGFDWLNRSQFKTMPLSEIERFTTALSDLYFLNAPDAFPIIREFLEERFNKEIKTELARNELRREGRLLIKEWTLDPTLRELLTRETTAYLQTYSPFGAGRSTITRPQADEVTDHLLDPEGPSVVLLTGVAGSGKSGVIRSVIEQLTARGILHLSLRIDQHLDCTTRAALGVALVGRPESPASTLKGVEPENRSVLIVDQVDAVSEVSGRNGVVKNVVLQLVDDVRTFQTVRIVLVCRSFDLESDSRLKSLKEREGVVHIDVPLLDWRSDVEPLLISSGIEVARLAENQRQLLCLPVNLAIFLEVRGDADSFFGSRTDLFRRLIDAKDRSIRHDRHISWSLIAPLSALARWMSERQRLDAPRDIIASYGGALDTLTSENLIVQSRDHVNFFHESFFDYIYARSFVTTEQSLVSLLCSSEQHLFRRTQARQILETLRQSDFGRYIHELQGVLSSGAVRYHIKVAIAQWLGALSELSAQERDLLLGLDDNCETFSPLLQYALLTSSGSFKTLTEAGWIETVLAGEQPKRVQSVLWWLSQIAGTHSAKIAALLEGWWGNDSEKGKTLLRWFSSIRRQKPDRVLADLCERVIHSEPASLFDRERFNVRGLLLSAWTAEHSEFGGNILRAFFEAWYDTHPGRHPFEREELRDLDMHAFGEMAKKAPEAFVEGSIDALIRAVDIVAQREGTGRRDFSFHHRVYSGHRFGADAFLGEFRSALCGIAKTDPDFARAMLAKIDASKHEMLTHIHLEVIRANGEALGQELMALLDNPFLLEAGWDGADWKSFADAAEAALPYFGLDDVQRLEDVVLAHWPEKLFAADCAKQAANDKSQRARWRNSSIHYLNLSGFEQLCILQVIGENGLTDRGRHRLRTLHRKFPNFELPQPNHHEAHLVGSPIKSDKAARMTDAQWLQAIARYDREDDSRFGHTFIDGGARQLAGELQHLAKKYPARFGKLAKDVPDEANTAYLQHILWGLAEAEADEEIIKQAVLNAHPRQDRPFGCEIARLFQRYPKIAHDPALLDILLWYVQWGDANEDPAVDHNASDREVITIESLLGRGSQIHIRGLNGARGWAAEALGAVLWELPEAAESVWEILQARIAEEELISVRCCLVETLTPLFNRDKERCAQLMDRLTTPPQMRFTPKFNISESVLISLLFPPSWLPAWTKALGVNTLRIYEYVSRSVVSRFGENGDTERRRWLAPLITEQGTYLLPFILRSAAPMGKKLIWRLLSSGDKNMRQIAAWHIFRVSFQDPEYALLADRFLEEGAEYRKLASDVASHSVVHDEFRHRAENQLMRFFSDENKDVRTEAADVFRNIEPNDFIRFYELGEGYLESQAFEEEGSFAFLHSLKEATCDVADLVVRAAEIVILESQRTGTASGRRDMDLHQLQELIKQEYSASEHNPELRKRLLDVIDAMLSRELYGVDEILRAHER